MSSASGKNEVPSIGELSSSPLPSFSSSSSKVQTDLDAAMSSAQYDCNLLIPQLLTHNLLTNGLCNFCKLSLHLHHQFANSSSTSSTNLSKFSSTNKLLKS